MSRVRPATERPRAGSGWRTGAVVIGGDYQGLGIVRSLGRAGVPVIVLDDELSISQASRFSRRTVRAPSLRDEAATLAALRALRERHGLRGWLLYPTREETVAALARHRGSLAGWFRVPTPPWEIVRCAWDKRVTYAVAQELGVATPRTWCSLDREGIGGIDMSGPVIVKPAIKEHFVYRTGAKAWRADTAEELSRRFEEAADLVGDAEVIVQELVPGDGAHQFAYCALFKNGASLAAMTVRRRRQHPSDFGRASTMVETVTLPAIEEPSIRFLRAIDYYGLVEMEYKLDPRDGQYKLLDVNARTWGYHSLGRAAGVDFPHLLYRDQLGCQPAPVRARPGVRWIRLVTDLPNAAADIGAGRLGIGDYLRSLRGIDVEAVFSFQDPLPGLYELLLLPYLFVKRGL